MNLFAYGTLMCSDIMAEVIGMQAYGTPATLTGYRRWCVKHEPYPALCADKGSVVTGIVYRHLTTAARDALDRFEGEMYARTAVQARLCNGTTVAAQTYIIKACFIDALEFVDWNYESFLRHGKTIFCESYKGYHALK